MSLDFYLEIPEKCANCGHILPGKGTDLFDRNLTHNVTPMWRRAGVYDVLYMHEGKRCGDYIQTLEDGLTDMLENFSAYKALDAPNGWGLAEHAAAFLWAVVKAVRANPDAVIHISK